MIIVTFAQKRKKGQNLISLHLETGAGPFRSEYSPEEDLQPAPTIRMNVGLQRLIKLTRRRFLQLEKKSFDINENFRPSLELEGLGLLPGEDFSENGNRL